jgi:hypothetical protein
MTTIFSGDTGASAVAANTVGNSQVIDGSLQPTKLAQKLTLATAQNTTSGTSIDFTGIPAWAKKITVMLNGVSTNGASAIQVQLGTSGGIDAAGYTSGSGLAFGTNNTLTYGSTTGFATMSGAANVITGHMVITNTSANTWIESLVATTASGGLSGGGSKTLSGTLDRIRLTTVNGTDTFDAGVINIMYEG